MIIIDNLFTTKQINELKSLIQNDITKYDKKFKKYDDEVDHHDYDDCGLYHLQTEITQLYLQFLIEKNIFDKKCLEENDLTLRYHNMVYPYHSTFHRDRLTDWKSDEIDYIGVTYFMNKEWDYKDGGLFLFKENEESNTGQYVEPIGNRIVINDDDLYHAVTKINNKEVTRTSLQMFINKKYLIN
jgi:hypothetical protein